jgi:3-methyladenine DNA glycosylase AlkD
VTYRQVIATLKATANPDNVAGMAQFGINPHGTLGISIVELRKLARKIGKDHMLAQQLWVSRIHEARILASYVDEPRRVTAGQLERGVHDFDSWDVCDQVTALFEQTPFAKRKIRQWATSRREFVKRAAFTMMAGLAVHDKTADDKQFEAFLPIIKRAATDDRNLVRKAVNWALRQIGKRNRALNRRAIAAAREIGRLESKAARWIAADALRELTDDKVQRRLRGT